VLAKYSLVCIQGIVVCSCMRKKYCIHFLKMQAVLTETATGMLQACLWLSVGAACGGAFVGGLVVLLMARL
jgi:hypothetical protein